MSSQIDTIDFIALANVHKRLPANICLGAFIHMYTYECKKICMNLHNIPHIRESLHWNSKLEHNEHGA